MDKVEGRTYSLPEDGEYYLFIFEQVDRVSKVVGGLGPLDKLLSEQVACETPVGTGIQKVKTVLRSFKSKILGRLASVGKFSEHANSAQVNNCEKEDKFEKLFSQISSRISTLYTPNLEEFIASLPGKHIEIFGISVRGYHLRMLHIEVINQLMRDNFRKKASKVVILPHCLRDFRAEECKFQPGDVDYICKGCTKDCLINQSRIFLKDYPDYHLYISQIVDLEKLFGLARQCYGDIGLLGVACVPELYEGMTLALKMGIPTQGVPLNYNRCSRWMGEAQYTNFNLNQLTRIIRANTNNSGQGKPRIYQITY